MSALSKNPTHSGLIAAAKIAAEKAEATAWGKAIDSEKDKGDTPLGCLMRALYKNKKDDNLIAVVKMVAEKAEMADWNKEKKSGDWKKHTPLMFFKKVLEKNPQLECIKGKIEPNLVV